MRYISTRGQAPALPFAETMLTGLARDGGLYVPEAWPTLSTDAIAGLAGTGSVAGGAASLGAGGAALNSNPHAALGVQNGINDSINQAKDHVAGSINDLNIPGVPPVHFN